MPSDKEMPNPTHISSDTQTQFIPVAFDDVERSQECKELAAYN